MENIERYFSDFSAEQHRQFSALHLLYKEWNEKINVISRKDIDNFYINHVLHALAIATQFTFTSNMKVMDLGAGGGFPGVPLAIFFPETHFTLVDSINKKLKVVQEISSAISLTNVSVRHIRVEDLKQEKFDVVVSRAVAPLKVLWQWSKPLITKNKQADMPVPNGLICLKGGDLTQEIFESGCKPFVWEIEKIFAEPYFEKKYMLYQKI